MNPARYDSCETRTDWDDAIASEAYEREQAILKEFTDDGFELTRSRRAYAERKAAEEIAEKYAPDFG